MASALGNVFQIFGRNAQRLSISKVNVRYKSVKAAVLKNFKEPLVIDQIKLEKKLKKNQVSLFSFLTKLGYYFINKRVKKKIFFR